MVKLIHNQFALQKGNILSFSREITKEESKSKVFFALEIEDENAKHLEYELEQIFRECFFDDATEVLLRFENCMKKVNEQLHSFEGNISGIIAGQQGHELHLSQTGKGEAYLIRKGKLNVIIENIDGKEEEEKGDTFVSIASGDLLVDDKVILSSLRVLRYATASQLVSVLSEGITEGMEALKELIELEVQCGSLLCFHVKGESIFAHMEDGSSASTRKIRSSFFNDVAIYIEKTIHFLCEKTGKSYDFIQNAVFGTLGVVFIIILITSISSMAINNADKAMMDQYKTQILKIDKELQIAETRAQMNELSSSNAILNKVETDVKAMLEKGVFMNEGLAILERVQNQRDAANNIVRFKNMNERVLADISAVSVGEKIRGITLLNNDLYAVTQKSLFKTVLNHIDPKIIVTKDSEIVRVSNMEDKNLLFITLASGVQQEFVDGKIQPAITEDASGFKAAVTAKAYSRYVYFLSPKDNQIWKYERKRDGYSGASAWLVDKANIVDGIDMAIDGSMYVLKKDGGVALFHKGGELSLRVDGGDPALLTKATQIFVKPDMKKVYFLNPIRNSVIAFTIVNKGLQFTKEYVFETATPIVDFFVDKNEQRLVIADSEKLYEITL